MRPTQMPGHVTARSSGDESHSKLVQALLTSTSRREKGLRGGWRSATAHMICERSFHAGAMEERRGQTKPSHGQAARGVRGAVLEGDGLPQRETLTLTPNRLVCIHDKVTQASVPALRRELGCFATQVSVCEDGIQTLAAGENEQAKKHGSKLHQLHSTTCDTKHPNLRCPDVGRCAARNC